jgi:thioredoxin 1
MNISIPIHVNDDSFEIAVTKSPVPVLVDFWGPSCGPCKMMDPLLDEIARERSGTLRVAKVNVADNPQLLARFGIRATPTLLVFHGGEVTQKFTGATGKSALLGAVDGTKPPAVASPA